MNNFYEKEYEPSKWIRIEEQNDKFGVMSLRTDWHLGGVNRGLVAYRRDITYLGLMSDKDKEKLLDVLTGDEWEDLPDAVIAPGENRIAAVIVSSYVGTVTNKPVHLRWEIKSV